MLEGENALGGRARRDFATSIHNPPVTGKLEVARPVVCPIRIGQHRIGDVIADNHLPEFTPKVGDYNLNDELMAGSHVRAEHPEFQPFLLHVGQHGLLGGPGRGDRDLRIEVPKAGTNWMAPPKSLPPSPHRPANIGPRGVLTRARVYSFSKPNQDLLVFIPVSRSVMSPFSRGTEPVDPVVHEVNHPISRRLLQVFVLFFEGETLKGLRELHEGREWKLQNFHEPSGQAIQWAISQIGLRQVQHRKDCQCTSYLVLHGSE